MKQQAELSTFESELDASCDLPYYLPHGNEIELFTHAYNNQLPLLIKGPTGCGKTRFITHMAERLGRPLYTVSCHDDLTAADLVGRHLIGDGATYWNDGPVMTVASCPSNAPVKRCRHRKNSCW